MVLDLPPIGTANDGAAALAAVVAAVADGQMTPSEGAEVSQLVSATVSALATADFEQRLEALEKAAADSAARGVL